HWPPLSVLHPSLPIPPLTYIQCPPPLSANPSTGLHSVPSTPLCQSLHWPPLGALHPSLPIPSLASTQCPSTPLCQSLHWPPLSVLHPSLPIPPLTYIHQQIKFKILTTHKAIHNSAPSYITTLVSNYQPVCSFRSSQDLLLSSPLVMSSHAQLQDSSGAPPILWNSVP
ncbi:unnamed protein product, partial [Staurois parvus]